MSRQIITCVGAAVVLAANALAQGVILEVSGSRPVSLVADELEKRYHFAITYEDPSFYAPSQLEDVTTEVQRSPSSSRSGRVIVPRRESFRLPIPDTSSTSADTLQDLLQALIDQQPADSPQFTLRRMADRFDIVPVRNVDRDGRAVSLVSLLDSTINVPFRQRTAAEMVVEICASLSRETRPVRLGSAPRNALMSITAFDGAAHERARDVLMRTLERSGLTLSWRLYVGQLSPGQDGYMLNVHMVR